MAIKIGDRIPPATLKSMNANGPQDVTTDSLFADKTVMLFAVPGAFTPTCSIKQVPGYVQLVEKFKAKGIDEIVCLSVNDVFVMGAWAEQQAVGDKVRMLADAQGLFTKAMGLEVDLSAAGLGMRSTRYGMLVEKGVVKQLQIEENPGALDVSSAEKMLDIL